MSTAVESAATAEAKGAKKGKVEVEKIYQKKTQLEHILLRPDTYVGSVEVLEQEMWVWDFGEERMRKREIKYVPGLFKIFDEILGKLTSPLTQCPVVKTAHVFSFK